MLQIKFDNGKKEVTLNTEYVTAIDTGNKTILRIVIPESEHTFEDVSQLRKNTGSIQLFEGDVQKSEYYGFDLGTDGFLCNNDHERFTVDLTQRSKLDDRLTILENTVEEIMGMLMDMD